MEVISTYGLQPRVEPHARPTPSGKVQEDAMDRFYRQSGFLGNVLVLWYDHEATMRFAAGEHVDAECDAEIAEGALETYLCARHDGFREHPELKNGFEVRCENRREADHMTRVMAQITQETIPYRITWLDSTVRQRENVLA